MNMYMYDDDIHMNMPVEVTLECENKVLEYNDTEERPFMLPMKQPSYHYNIKRKDRLRRGRKKNEFVQRTFFLFQQSNPDHFPTKKERIMLTNQGLGKKGPMNINRSWTMAEMDKQISDWYNVPMLKIMGFTYYKNDIRRKLIKLNVQCVDELEKEVPAGGLVLLVPNHDLPLDIRPHVQNGLSATIKCEVMDEEEEQDQNSYLESNSDAQSVGTNHSTQTQGQKFEYNDVSLEPSRFSNNDNNKQSPTSFKSNETSNEDIQYNSVTKSLKDEIFNLKLQLNSSKQIRASLELQLCRKEEIILKTSDQLAKANEELWRLKNFIKRLGCNPEVSQQQQQNNKEKTSQQNANTTW